LTTLPKHPADKEGYTSFTINSDRSVTFLIPKIDYDEDLVQKREFLKTALQEITDGLQGVISSITFNDELTEFEVVVNREAFEADFEAQFISFTLNISSKLFQIYSEIPEDAQGGTVNFTDATTGKVFNSDKWPVEE